MEFEGLKADLRRPPGGDSDPVAAPTVAVTAHGCRANQEEVECLLSALRDRGFRTVPFGDPADWTVINTCSVTAAGEADARKAIRRAARASGESRVVVTGCFAQMDPVAAARLGADLVVGNAKKWKLPDLLSSAAAGTDACTGILFREDPTSGRFLRHGSQASGYRTRAALKIQDGCNEHCTYCIIPRLRGRSVSRPPEELLEEARLLVAAGHPEITLTGIHSASYGADSPTGDLASLLPRLLTVEGLDRIRINSLEPQWVTNQFLDALASSSRFCRHLHLPLQSGDAGILKKMGRGYSPDDYLRVVEAARERIAGVAIGVDVMVGFPGEDERALENTIALLEDVRPAYLHVFPFSERPGVAAIRLPEPVAVEERKDRACRLRTLDERFRAEFLMKADGEIHELLVEAKRDPLGRRQSLTDTYIRVDLETEQPAGSWVRARLRYTGDPRRMTGIPVDADRAGALSSREDPWRVGGGAAR